MVVEQDPKFFLDAMDNAIKADKALYDRLKGQYVKIGNRTMTVEALMMELETQNL